MQDFFDHYGKHAFTLYQANQNGGTQGTLWTGKVLDVTPTSGQPITKRSYINEKGKQNSIAAPWQWGDGSQCYKVLQLVGNAYDAKDLSKLPKAGASGLSQGEYQGAVINLYFPYFSGNTGLSSLSLPSGDTYALPSAPSWLTNAKNGPSQMVFGCSGVFATPNDPDALAQSGFSALAKNALTNLQNVIVSALNRGVATGYAFALKPQGYTSQVSFSEAPVAAPDSGGLPAGRYTYCLSGVLNDGSESAVSWTQTIVLSESATVTLSWNPQQAALYQSLNVYRQNGTGPAELIGTVTNTHESPATQFTDSNAALPPKPTTGAPFLFYPAWEDPKAPHYVPSNLYSAFLHQNLSSDPEGGVNLNGLTYGYPFDDQGGFSTNIDFGTALPTTPINFQIAPERITVNSTQAWQSTGVDVNGIQEVTVTYDGGNWTSNPNNDNGELFDADGNPNIMATQPGYTLVGKNEGALIGKVGTHPSFYIGDGPTVVPSGQKGTLQLCINDDLEGVYGAGLTDNRGSVTVRVSIR